MNAVLTGTEPGRVPPFVTPERDVSRAGSQEKKPEGRPPDVACASETRAHLRGQSWNGTCVHAVRENGHQTVSTYKCGARLG